MVVHVLAKRHLERHLDGGGAIIAVEHTLGPAAANGVQQAASQLHSGLHRRMGTQQSASYCLSCNANRLSWEGPSSALPTCSVHGGGIQSTDLMCVLWEHDVQVAASSVRHCLRNLWLPLSGHSLSDATAGHTRHRNEIEQQLLASLKVLFV